MEELNKLIGIVRKKGQRSIQLVNQNFRKKEKSKDNLLFEGMVEGRFSSEEAASRQLFNAEPGNRNFRNTKAKLKNKLLNHLYFLDYDKSGYTAFMKARYELLHMLHQMKILLMEETDCIAVKKLPQLVKMANEFELVEIALEGLLLLRNEFSLQGKCTPVLHSEHEIENLKPFHKAVISSEDIYYDTMVLIRKSMSSSEKIMEDIPRKIATIRKQATRFNSARLDVLSRKLEIAYNEIQHDYEANLKLCNYLEDKYIPSDIADIRVDLNYKDIFFLKLFCLYALGKVEEGAAFVRKRSGMFREGAPEWFKFREYEFLMLMKGEKIHQATKVFRAVRTSKNYSELSKKDKERWTIYRAYILFVNDTKLVKWGFDIDQFLETIPRHPRKRMGYNIATLIIQYLFMLRSGDIKKASEKLESLKPMSSVHLDKRHNYRNSIFIRMLELIHDKEFDHQLVAEKGQTYLNKLIETQIPPDMKQELEIIPFEKLWEYVLNILRTNKNYLHYRFYHLSEA